MHAYIISAYKRPDLLFRLVEGLGGVPAAIHVDRKSPIGPEVERRAASYTNVTLLPRHVCHWGLFGHVEASIEGLKWFAEGTATHAVLLTGQCYPIKPNAVIEAMIAGLGTRSVIETSALPKPEWMRFDDGGYKRIDRFYVKVPGRPMPKAVRLWSRRMPFDLQPYGGSSYWCLSRLAADYVLDYIESHKAITRFFRTTYIPDELFFQTILSNSKLSGSLESRLIHYTDWSKGGTGPAILTSDMLPPVLASDAWFARKFDSVEVPDQIDAARGS